MPDNNNMNFGVDLLPVTNNSYYLGKSDKKWKIQASEINGKDISSSNVATMNDVNSSKIEILNLMVT